MSHIGLNYKSFCAGLAVILSVNLLSAVPVVQYEWDSANYLPTAQGWTYNGAGALSNNTTDEALTVNNSPSGSAYFQAAVPTANLTDASGWTLTAVLRVDHASSTDYAITLAVDTGSAFWNFCFYTNVYNSALNGVHTRSTSPPAIFLKAITDWNTAFHTIQMIDDDGSDATAPKLYIDGVTDSGGVYAANGGTFLSPGTIFWGSANSGATSTSQWQVVSFEVGQHPVNAPEPPTPVTTYEYDPVDYLPSEQGWTISSSGAELLNDTVNEALTIHATNGKNVNFQGQIPVAYLNDPSGWTLTGILRVRHTDTYNWGVTLAVDTGSECWNFCFYNNIYNPGITGIHARTTTSETAFIKYIPDFGTNFYVVQMIHDPCSPNPPELYLNGFADTNARLWARDGGTFLPTGTVIWGSANSAATSDSDWQYVSFQVGKHPMIPLQPGITESRWSRGQDILMRRGLQIQAQVFPYAATPACFDLNRWELSNFTTANFHWDLDPNIMGPAPGIPWGRYMGGSVTDAELPYYENLISLQYNDEQNLNQQAQRTLTADALYGLRTIYPEVLSYSDQYFDQVTDENMRLYMRQAKPDMLMQNGYVFQTGKDITDLYENLERYRELSLEGCDPNNVQPIPHGVYTQGIRIDRYPSESEIRINQFAAWTFGCKFVSAFVYNSDVSGDLPILFTGDCDTTPRPEFNMMAETNRQSRNLGNALVRLISTDVRMIANQHSLPSNISAWDTSADPYIKTITATNLGSVNSGQPGDVLIGYFKPLHELLDGPDYQNQIYFMVLNGLTGPTATLAQTRQEITLTFDFGTSGITSLQRLSRTTGAVENVPLIPLGGSQYRLTLTLDGGTGDLFKFNTGAPFVNGPLYCGDPGFAYLDADFTGSDDLRDCTVRLDDFTIMQQDWLTGPVDRIRPRADISGPQGEWDGFVDLYDLAKFSSQWLDTSSSN